MKNSIDVEATLHRCPPSRKSDYILVKDGSIEELRIDGGKEILATPTKAEGVARSSSESKKKRSGK